MTCVIAPERRFTKPDDTKRIPWHTWPYLSHFVGLTDRANRWIAIAVFPLWRTRES